MDEFVDYHHNERGAIVDPVVKRLKRFLPMATAVAAMSKSPTSKVGAIVLGPDFEVRSTGWNGAPRGSKADEDSRSEDRDARLLWTAHAEANAIAQAARAGTALKGCYMLVTHTPCAECAKLIVQAGIVVVVAPKPDPDFSDRWKVSLMATRSMLRECGVQLHEF